MKKIISFSVWGNNPKYTNSAIENLNLQKELYPDWICRFYVDNSVPSNIIQQLENDSEIVIKPKSDGNYGLLWRFEPLIDTSIERFIVRDTDSRLSPREVAAVKEWEESQKEFHIMRDHEQHAAYICGGMWGASSKFVQKYKDEHEENLNNFIRSLGFNQIYHTGRGKYFNVDQLYLWKYIWPRIVNTHIAHIKNIPSLRFTGNEKLFPIENKDKSFVGEPVLRRTFQ